MKYDLTDLRLFLAIAEEGNLTRGAARTFLSPPSASNRLKSLEEVLGVQLVNRSSRGISLSSAGHVVQEHARRCLAQLEQMHIDLEPYAAGVHGHISCFANNNAISAHLPRDLETFFRSHPNVRVTLEERLSSEIASSVLQGRADVGVLAVDVNYSDLVYLPYRQDRLDLVVPVDHPLADAGALPFGQCLDFPFISLQTGAALHTFLINHAMAIGRRLDIRVQVSSYSAIVRLVASGAGIGIVPRSALHRTDLRGVATRKIKEDWAFRDLHVCLNKNRQPGSNPNIVQFVLALCGEHLRELLNQHIAPAP